MSQSKENINSRLLSIDVFRGITIFLMIMVNTPGSWDYVYTPLRHSFWHGCTLTDLVFPSFIFVIGLSMSLSFKKIKDKKKILRNLLRRSILIFIIGVLLNWFPFFNTNIEDVRILGVLQRIALSYLIAGMIVVCFIKTRFIIISSLFLLFVHWIILYCYGGSDPYSLTGNISKEIDILFFTESHIYKGFNIPFDPEGILGTVSSASQVLLGFLTGRYIFNERGIEQRKLFILAVYSVLLILFGLMWNVLYPINKPLWTGSFVIYTTGIFLMVFTLLIWIIDVKNRISWSFLFIVFGRNSLISYLLSIICLKVIIYLITIDGKSLYVWSFQQIFSPLLNNYFASFLYAISFTLFIWAFTYILFLKQKIIKI